MADSDDDLAPSNELPRVRSDASVDVELGLCQALAACDPWVTPTDHIVDNLRVVKASDTLMVSDAELVNSPDITVRKADILEVITLKKLDQIPYTALDKLRREHMIDVTGISLRQTHLRGLYRAHVITTNRFGDMDR